MKKNIKIIIIGFVIIAILLAFIVTMINRSNKVYVRPNYDYVATVYHSEMLGMDAGTEYTYYIYASSQNENDYFYIKSRSIITIAGPSKREDIGSGSIRNKKDLMKLKQAIEKDSRKDSQSHIVYTYVNGETSEICGSINALGNKLFK